jgi:CRISPR/Cas system CMR-associated protein Cmr5 small subunit
MENLEQRRAANALRRATDCRKQQGEGDCLSGYPGLVINNGLLSCLAYSLEKEGQHLRVVNAIAFHLDDLEICQRLGGGDADAAWLLRHLIANGTSAHTLRRATAESLAFLGYLKRFVKTPSLQQQP